MLKNIYLLVILLVVFSCGTKNKSGADMNTETDDVTSTLDKAIQDTMIVDGRIDLIKTADSQGEIVATLEQCTVFVLDQTPVPNIHTTNVVDTFIHVRTLDNDTGYVWKKALITLSHLRARNDSIDIWAKRPMPLYKNLVGTSYWRNDELPFELSPGGFISLGQANRYGIVSMSNRYTDRYSYLFFVENTGRIKDERDNELMIHDIIHLNWEELGPEAQVWFRQCECVDSDEGDCSEVVAVYKHSTEMAKQGILVTPIKAWKPDYLKSSLVEIDVETVKCGSMAPEEDDGAKYFF